MGFVDDVRDVCDAPVAGVQGLGSGGHRLGEEKARSRGLRAGEVDQRRDRGLRGLLGWGVLDGLVDLGEQLLVAVGERGEEAVVLVGEVLVEGGARDARLRDRPRDARGGVALVHRDLGHRVQQPRALGALGGLGAPGQVGVYRGLRWLSRGHRGANRTAIASIDGGKQRLEPAAARRDAEHRRGILDCFTVLFIG